MYLYLYTTIIIKEKYHEFVRKWKGTEVELEREWRS